MATSTKAATALAPVWGTGSTIGHGHLSLEAERAQLRTEIQARMDRVEKMLSNPNQKQPAAQRIATVESIKAEINERKSRLVELKVAARAAPPREPTSPRWPADAAAAEDRPEPPQEENASAPAVVAPKGAALAPVNSSKAALRHK